MAVLIDLFPRLGIAEKINAKVTPRGTDATGMVAAGGADLVVMPISEIVHAAGVDFAGSLAAEIQFVQTFSAAVVAGSRDIESSKRLIDFLASARASEAIRKAYPQGAAQVVVTRRALARSRPATSGFYLPQSERFNYRFQ